MSSLCYSRSSSYTCCGFETSVLWVTNTRQRADSQLTLPASLVAFFTFRGEDFSLLLDCKQISKGHFPFLSIWEACVWVEDSSWWPREYSEMMEARTPSRGRCGGPAQLSHLSSDPPAPMGAHWRAQGAEAPGVSCEQGWC